MQVKNIPYNLEAEAAVLGAVLLKPEVIDEVSSLIGPGDFYTEANRLIFANMLTMVDEGQDIDLVTVAERLRASGNLKRIGGAVYLAKLSDSVIHTAHVAEHAKIVKERAIARSLIDEGLKMANKAASPGADVVALLDQVAERIHALSERRGQAAIESVGQIMPEVINQIVEREKHRGRVWGLATGFHDLDTLTAGLQPGNMFVVAGRPGMGKTALAMNIAANVARAGRQVLIFSLEMTKTELGFRLVCAEARVPSQKLKAGLVDPKSWDRINKFKDHPARWNLHIDDTGAKSIGDIRTAARQYRRKHDIALVVVDYLQLVTSAQKYDVREREVTWISGQLKAMAKELELPVIAVSQLNRDTEKREKTRNRPRLSDLRESGAIEQDADLIGFVYRPAVYDRAADPTLAELIIAKHRNGPVDTIRLRWDGPLTRFDNLAHGGGPGPV